MAVTWAEFVKAASQNAKAGCINQGSGPGKLKVGTLGYNGAGTGVLLATFVLADPCAPTTTTDTLAFDGLPITTQGLVGAGTGQVPGTAIFTDSDDVVCGTGMSVGVHVADVDDPDIVLDAAWIVENQNVTLLSLSAVHG